MIKVEHGLNLFNNYGGPKSLKCCDKGGHNTRRPKNIKKEIGEFFYKYLCTNALDKEKKDTNTIHNYITTNEKNNNNNLNNNVYFEDNDEDDYEYEENYQDINEIDEDNLQELYEEDYIVNQILESQNGGKN